MSMTVPSPDKSALVIRNHVGTADPREVEIVYERNAATVIYREAASDDSYFV